METVGHIVTLFEPQERADYFKSCGYDPEQLAHALGVAIWRLQPLITLAGTSPLMKPELREPASRQAPHSPVASGLQTACPIISSISRSLNLHLINLVRQRTDRWRFNAGAPDMEEGAADIMDDEIRLKVSLLDALANPVRFRVVSHLIGHEMSISELTGKCRTTRRNVTYALTQLHRDGFVSRRFEKQTALYSCCHPGIIRLFDVTSGIIQADRKEIDLERRRSRSSRHRCAGEVEQ